MICSLLVIAMVSPQLLPMRDGKMDWNRVDLVGSDMAFVGSMDPMNGPLHTHVANLLQQAGIRWTTSQSMIAWSIEVDKLKEVQARKLLLDDKVVADIQKPAWYGTRLPISTSAAKLADIVPAFVKRSSEWTDLLRRNPKVVSLVTRSGFYLRTPTEYGTYEAFAVEWLNGTQSHYSSFWNAR